MQKKGIDHQKMKRGHEGGGVVGGGEKWESNKVEK